MNKKTKSLKMRKFRINYLMNKRGQIEVLIAIIVLAVVLIGGYYVANILPRGELVQGEPPQSKYVANSETQKVCTIDNINFVPAENRINFLKLEDALKLGFTYSENCIN